MTAMKLIAHAVCLSAALGVCGLAVAGSPCSGNEVVNANGDHVILADNPTLPNHLAVGTCLTYEKPAESAQGTAKQIRGTGKYAKTQSSFQYRDAGWVETLQVFAWSGECE